MTRRGWQPHVQSRMRASPGADSKPQRSSRRRLISPGAMVALLAMLLADLHLSSCHAHSCVQSPCARYMSYSRWLPALIETSFAIVHSFFPVLLLLFFLPTPAPHIWSLASVPLVCHCCHLLSVLQWAAFGRMKGSQRYC